jgi:hypothetical protein
MKNPLWSLGQWISNDAETMETYLDLGKNPWRVRDMLTSASNYCVSIWVGCRDGSSVSWRPAPKCKNPQRPDLVWLRHDNRVFSLRADRFCERIRKRLRRVKVASSKVGIPNAVCAILELTTHVDGDRWLWSAWPLEYGSSISVMWLSLPLSSRHSRRTRICV